MSLEDLKNRVKEYPVSQILGMYIHVTKKGAHHTAVCPFHDDHNPSLSINDSKGLFHCFVDNTGGDAITFVRKLKNLEFVDALKDICDKMGWNFEDYVEKKKKSPKFEMADKILSRAAQIYKKVASENPPEFKEFIEKRNLTAEIVKDFCIGYSQKSSVITGYLESIKSEKDRNFALQTAKEIHLIRPDNKSQGHYDTYRERIMFPIWDQFGHVVGFGGRQTKEYQKGKYINSQESFYFNKKNILYGLNIAKNEIRQKDSVILTEGYMDCIALHQANFRNSIAVMGVALSEYALNQLTSLTKNIYMALDGDDAGFNAMKRINELCMSHNLLPKMIDLSPHKDPDEFVQNEGKLAFAKRIEEARALVDVIIDREFPEVVPEVTDRQIEILQGFFAILAPLKTSLLATERITGLAKRLGMTSDSTQIIESYKEYLKNQNDKRPMISKTSKPEAKLPEAEKDSTEIKVQQKPRKLSKMEVLLVQEITQNPQCLEMGQLTELLDFVGLDEVKSYILRLKDLYYEIDESEYAQVVSNITSAPDFNLELKEVIGAALFRYDGVAKDNKIIEKIVSDLKFRLMEDQLKTKRKELKEEQKKATSVNENEKILKELTSLDKELVQLRAQR